MGRGNPPNQNHQPPICFVIRGNGVCRSYAWVQARDLESARARLAPLFPGCELVPAPQDEVPRHAS